MSKSTDDLVFKNPPRDIAQVPEEMATHRGARFGFECYDLSHLKTLQHFVDRRLVKPPYVNQFIFGVLAGMAAEPDALTHMLGTADRLFGDDDLFSVLAADRMQIPMAAMAAAMGGHVRVGLEDSLCLGNGVLVPSNAAQVPCIRAIAIGLGRDVATPAEARAMLDFRARAGVVV